MFVNKIGKPRAWTNHLVGPLWYGIFVTFYEKSPQICIKFRTCSKPLRYRGDKSRPNRTDIAARLHMRFKDATRARQKLHRIAATKIAQKSPV